MEDNDTKSEPIPLLPAGILVLRVLLGLFFLYSGGMKVFVVGLSSFVDAVGNYQIVGAPWDAVVGYILPWVEIVAGLALVLGVASRGAAVIVLGMLVSFNVALAIAWSSGLEINCGCFGKSEEPTNYLVKILLNGGLMVVAMASLWADGRTDRLLPTPSPGTLSTT